MSRTANHIPQRLEELMVEQATQGLSAQDAAELQAAIQGDAALRAEAQAYELAATAAELSLTPDDGEALPAALRERLDQAGQAFLSTAGQSHEADSHLALSQGQISTPAPPKQDVVFSFTDGRMFGWYAAAAALIALAFTLAVQPNPGPGNNNPGNSSSGTIVQNPEPTLAQQYDTLANAPGTLAADWGFADGGDERYANCTGQVIWNNDTQTGYMKLAGLPINDPRQTQYQLWIVDGSRDTAVENTNRIDGGVFDITTAGESIIPIDAKLIARQAAAFAITVETPGGVVESKGPLQALAKVNG